MKVNGKIIPYIMEKTCSKPPTSNCCGPELWTNPAFSDIQKRSRIYFWFGQPLRSQQDFPGGLFSNMACWNGEFFPWFPIKSSTTCRMFEWFSRAFSINFWWGYTYRILWHLQQPSESPSVGHPQKGLAITLAFGPRTREFLVGDPAWKKRSKKTKENHHCSREISWKF